MRVFLAGATGALGRPLVARLGAAGHEVVGTTRSPARAAGLREAGGDSTGVASRRRRLVSAIQAA